jgi:nicotinamidase-related amidase
VNRPFRENLEVADHRGAMWVRCTRCGYPIAEADEDWREHCAVRRLPPRSMGPHRELLEGRLVLEERYCPGCGVTVDADVVDDATSGVASKSNRPARRKGNKSTTPVPVSLRGPETAVIVLDLHVKACEPSHVGHSLIRSVPTFLHRARASSAHVIFIVPAWDKGLPEDRIAEPMARRPDEPVLYPHAYDKFTGGEMQSRLAEWGVKTLIFLGGSANFSLLYTATTAARIHGYQVVVPTDGIYAHSDYELEYALYQFTVLPRVADKFHFTSLQGIQFIER